MKKTLLFLLLLCFSGIAFCQKYKIDEDTKLITYSEVIEVPNVSKDELYLRANTWLSRAFKSAKAVIDVQDKEAGKIIAKGNVMTIIKVPLVGKQEAGAVEMTITIQTKDGKYKYTVDNLQHSKPFNTPGNWASIGPLEQEKAKAGMMVRPSNSEWKDLKEDAFKSIESMVEDLKKAMNKAEKDF
ncbi:MAG: DUF4468 domain-containing protein [Spirosomataceae bacterium]